MIHKFQIAFIFLITLGVISNCAKKISISMVASTSIGEKLPITLLNGETWKPEPNAQYVKYHMHFDEIAPLSAVEVESCNNVFKDSILIFVNFDEQMKYTDEGKKIVRVEFNPIVSARSVTINFNKNQNICLSRISLFDEKNKNYSIKTPKLIQAEVNASETGKPIQSYHAMNLFDSRYEYAYASNKGSTGVYIDFQFPKKVQIEAIKFWNGYQRSDLHCVENGRVKTLELTGENYSESITLSDQLGSQVIQLPKPFKGNSLRMTVKEIYKGRKYPGFQISELRFYDGNDWFLVDPINFMIEIAKENREKFSQARIASILNRSLEGTELELRDSPMVESEFESSQVEDALSEEEIEDFKYKLNSNSSHWIFRFRSDSSFYLEGDTSNLNKDEKAIVERHFTALGNYEILKVDKKGIKLRIFGFLNNSQVKEHIIYGEGDCNGCGRDCNKLGMTEVDEGGFYSRVEKIFLEVLYIQKWGKKYRIKNLNDKKNLDFNELELVIL